MRCTLYLSALAVLLCMQLPASAVTVVTDFTAGDTLASSDWFEDTNAWTNKQRALTDTWTSDGATGLRYQKSNAGELPVGGGQPGSITSPDPNPGDPDGTDTAWSSRPIGYKDTIGFGPGTVNVPTVPAKFTIHIDDPDTVARWLETNNPAVPERMAGTSFFANLRLLNKETSFGPFGDPLDPDPGQEGLLPEMQFHDAGTLTGVGFNGINFGTVTGKNLNTTSLDFVVDITEDNIDIALLGNGGATINSTDSYSDTNIDAGDKLWFDFYFTRDSASDGAVDPRPVQADFTIKSLTVTTDMFMDVQVPEPSSLLLAGLVLVSLGLCRRRN